MIENTSNKIYIQKMGVIELKEVSFYLEYDPLYIHCEIKVNIYNDSYGTTKVYFNDKRHYIETYDNELYHDDDKLIDYVTKFVIAEETKRIEDIKKKYND